MNIWVTQSGPSTHPISVSPLFSLLLEYLSGSRCYSAIQWAGWLCLAAYSINFAPSCSREQWCSVARSIQHTCMHSLYSVHLLDCMGSIGQYTLYTLGSFPLYAQQFGSLCSTWYITGTSLEHHTMVHRCVFCCWCLNASLYCSCVLGESVFESTQVAHIITCN